MRSARRAPAAPPGTSRPFHLLHLSGFYIYRAEFETAGRIGDQLLALGERFDDARARVEGHLLVGASDGMLARLHAGNDPGVVSHLVHGMLLWMTGFPDRARARAQEEIQLAEQLHHPQSIAYAQFHTGLIHAWLREPERAAQYASAVIELGEVHDLKVWSAVGSCLYGVFALARLWGRQGRTSPARALLQEACDRLTEGFTTPDLIDARELLEELAPGG